MNKKELAEEIARKTNMTTDQGIKFLTTFMETVTEQLKKGERIQLVGFGRFETMERAARVGRNPKTGEKMNIAGSRVPKFKPGKALKDEIK